MYVRMIADYALAVKDKERICQMIDILQAHDWDESQHKRGEGGKFVSTGKSIGGVSPKDFKNANANFDDPDYFKKGVEFNKKVAHARGLALREMIKNPKTASRYAYLWSDEAT